ncbi:hypothetical protein B0T17DRAFT_511048 [Bombardia bombarda]|uniref:RING-type E3 ubiquitin transferase n=1 Tax=Bombardia bombarda TaxID=252184 RepID=A0AA39WH27_9PEZI|nr:hypothetical protein B0T17DRAFT_511048 [Bombardia bombarda]
MPTLQTPKRASTAPEPPDTHQGLPAVSIALCLVTIVIIVLFLIARKRAAGLALTETTAGSAGAASALQQQSGGGEGRILPRGLQRQQVKLRKVLPEEVLDRIPVVKYGATLAVDGNGGGSGCHEGCEDCERGEMAGDVKRVGLMECSLEGNGGDKTGTPGDRDKVAGTGVVRSTVTVLKEMVSGTGGATSRNDNNNNSEPEPKNVTGKSDRNSNDYGKNDFVDSSSCCPVCTDEFDDADDVRVLPCSHTFHQKCIDPWLLRLAGTCPVCRADLTEPAQQPISETEPQAQLPLPPEPPLQLDAPTLSITDDQSQIGAEPQSEPPVRRVTFIEPPRSALAGELGGEGKSVEDWS